MYVTPTLTSPSRWNTAFADPIAQAISGSMTLHDNLDALRIERLEQMLEAQQIQLRRIFEAVGLSDKPNGER